MPQPRKYASEAKRQAAYRKRRNETIKRQLADKGFDPMPVTASMPGWKRWNQMMQSLQRQLELMQNEMEGYYEDRTDNWKEGSNADELQDKIKSLKRILQRVEDWI